MPNRKIHMQPSTGETQPAACLGCGATTVRRIEPINGREMLACDRCSLRYVDPASRGDAVSYNDLYKIDGDYHAHVSEAETLRAGIFSPLVHARRIALAEIVAMRPAAVLEIGCGVGNFLSYLERASIPCYGLDLSSNAIEVARPHLKAPLHTGPLDAGVFAGVKFDVICSWEVIEHVTDLDEFLASIAGRLKPGGRLFLSTPNYDSRYLWNDVPHDPRMMPPVHLTFWNKPSMRALLARVGFGEIAVRRYSIPASAAQRSGSSVDRWLVYPDAKLRPSQRATLLASGTVASSNVASG